MKQVRKDYISKLEKLFAESLSVENRKQFKELLTKLSRTNMELAMDGLPIIENIPTVDSVDEICEGKLYEVVEKVYNEITNTEDKLDSM